MAEPTRDELVDFLTAEPTRGELVNFLTGADDEIRDRYVKSSGKEGTLEYVARRSLPIATTLLNRGLNRVAEDAMARYRAGEADADDLKVIGEMEARQTRGETKSTLARVGSAVMSLPAIAGEAALGGAVARPIQAGARVVSPTVQGVLTNTAARMATGLPRLAAQTAAMPSMYLEDFERRRTEAAKQGQDTPQAQLAAEAFTSGMIQTYVLGQLGRATPAVSRAGDVAGKAAGLGKVARTATVGGKVAETILPNRVGDLAGIAYRTGTGLVESEVASAIEKASGLKNHYGTLTELARGEGDVGDAVAHAVTFAIFSALHSGADRETRERMVYQQLSDFNAKMQSEAARGAKALDAARAAGTALVKWQDPAKQPVQPQVPRQPAGATAEPVTDVGYEVKNPRQIAAPEGAPPEAAPQRPTIQEQLLNRRLRGTQVAEVPEPFRFGQQQSPLDAIESGVVPRNEHGERMGPPEILDHAIQQVESNRSLSPESKAIKTRMLSALGDTYGSADLSQFAADGVHRLVKRIIESTNDEQAATSLGSHRVGGTPSERTVNASGIVTLKDKPNAAPAEQAGAAAVAIDAMQKGAAADKVQDTTLDNLLTEAQTQLSLGNSKQAWELIQIAGDRAQEVGGESLVKAGEQAVSKSPMMPVAEFQPPAEQPAQKTTTTPAPRMTLLQKMREINKRKAQPVQQEPQEGEKHPEFYNSEDYSQPEAERRLAEAKGRRQLSVEDQARLDAEAKKAAEEKAIIDRAAKEAEADAGAVGVQLTETERAADAKLRTKIEDESLSSAVESIETPEQKLLRMVGESKTKSKNNMSLGEVNTKVIQLKREGKTNAEIAAEIGYKSEGSVRARIEAITKMAEEIRPGLGEEVFRKGGEEVAAEQSQATERDAAEAASMGLRLATDKLQDEHKAPEEVFSNRLVRFARQSPERMTEFAELFKQAAEEISSGKKGIAFNLANKVLVEGKAVSEKPKYRMTPEDVKNLEAFRAKSPQTGEFQSPPEKGPMGQLMDALQKDVKGMSGTAGMFGVNMPATSAWIAKHTGKAAKWVAEKSAEKASKVIESAVEAARGVGRFFRGLEGKPYQRIAGMSEPIVDKMASAVRGGQQGEIMGDVIAKKLTEGLDQQTRKRYGAAFQEQKMQYAYNQLQQEYNALMAAGQLARAKKVGRQMAEINTRIGKADSPLKTFQDFQDVLNDPKYQEVIKGWSREGSPLVDAMYREAKGFGKNQTLKSDRYQMPGLYFTSIPKDKGAGESKGGPKKWFRSMRRAALSGESYENDIQEIFRRSISERFEPALYRRALNKLVDGGLAVRGQAGQTLEGFVEIPKQFTSEVRKKGGSLYVREDVAKDVQAWADKVESKNIPVITNFGRVLATLSMAGTREAMVHSKNILTQVFKPKMIRNLPQALIERAMSNETIAKAVESLMRPFGGDKRARDFHYASRLKQFELARLMADRPGHGLESQGILSNIPYLRNASPIKWTGHMLHVLDSVVRIASLNAYESMERTHGAVKSDTGRREFINQIGNYHRRAQSAFVRALKDSGVNPFATAASNFYMQGWKIAMGADPGVKGRDWRATAALRLHFGLKLAAVPAIAGAINYALWGDVNGDEATPPGHIKIGEEDGKAKYIDLFGMTPIGRALRQMGATGFIDSYYRSERTKAEAYDQAIEDIIGRAAAIGEGPLVNFVKSAVTGKDGLGREITADVDPGESKIKERLIAAGIHSNQITESLENPIRRAIGQKERYEAPKSTEQAFAEFVQPFGPKYKRTAEQRALSDIHTLRSRFLHSQGKPQPVKMESSISHLIDAAQAGDVEAFRKAKAEYTERLKKGHKTDYGIYRQFRESVERFHPLEGRMTVRDQLAFRKSLTDEQKKKLDTAMEYTKKMRTKMLSMWRSVK